MAIFDIFISYSSKDRPWAKKLWQELRTRYPNLLIFWDRESIPAGDLWRKELQNAIRNTKHMVVIWSDHANSSLEVGPEIEAFNAHLALKPKLEGSERKGFYIPLQGDRGGGIQDYQGFPDFKGIYNPADANMGLAALAGGQAMQDWERMIRMIGDAAARADDAQAITAAIAATTSDVVTGLLNHTHDKKTPGTHITLDQLLDRFGLKWEEVRDRYGPSPFDWRPCSGRSIVELLEGVRVRVNAKLDESDRFRWTYVDLTADDELGNPIAENLHDRPSVVVFDPVSLFDPYCAAAMRRLNRYVIEKKSVILSLSPNLKTDEDVYGTCLRDLSLPLFDDYFHPGIPPIGEFQARCAPDVQMVSQMDRLIRNRIRDLRVDKLVDASKATTGYK